MHITCGQVRACAYTHAYMSMRLDWHDLTLYGVVKTGVGNIGAAQMHNKKLAGTTCYGAAAVYICMHVHTRSKHTSTTPPVGAQPSPLRFQLFCMPAANL